MKKIYMRVDGMHCSHCIDTITNSLYKIKNIKNVKINKNIVEITYKYKLSKEELINNILNIDYYTNEEYISENKKDIDNNIKLKEFIFIVATILIISILLYKLLGFNILNIIPNIDNNITYGMLFITGLLTSIHCISMCGAIFLTTIVNTKRSIKKALFYNLGRVISYTIIGFIVGLIGSTFTLNDTLNGIVVILAGILMLSISFSMLGLINFRKIFNFNFKIRSRNPLIIGLLNGLMPCGPIDAMKIYALSTGSPIRGAISMLLFGLGTVPLMLAVGYIFNLFKGRKKIIINKLASTLILILSLIMLNRGLLYLNIDISSLFRENYDNYSVSNIDGDIQTVKFNLDYSNYQDILLLEGIKTKIIIHVSSDKLTSCNNEIVIKEFNIKKKLKVGDNIIEFTPDEAGDFSITCWMNMIHNNLKVTSNKTYFNKRTKGDKIPVRLKTPASRPVKAVTNNDGNIVIKKNKITTKVTYIDYVYEDIHIGLIAVRTSDNRVIVVVNTCTSCNPSPRAYFIQVGDYLECQNCGNKFKIDELDKVSSDGCNPMQIEKVEENDKEIIISKEFLNSLKDKFSKWLGPKVEEN